jgi:hypothetical protein
MFAEPRHQSAAVVPNDRLDYGIRIARPALTFQ